MVKKKRHWFATQLTVGFNVLFAKVEAVFGRETIPKKATRTQRSRANREVRSEIVTLAKTESQPQNIVAKTISEIAEKERKKAIRSGDYGDAIVASIIKFYADQANNASKNQVARWG